LLGDFATQNGVNAPTVKSGQNSASHFGPG
jgi:hypothetical protein